jgi:hypothetical protein
MPDTARERYEQTAGRWRHDRRLGLAAAAVLLLTIAILVWIAVDLAGEGRAQAASALLSLLRIAS